MKKKQTTVIAVDKHGDLVAPNRKTYREYLSKGFETTRVNGLPVKRDEPKRFGVDKLTPEMREYFARLNGSKTGKFKKKHLHRQRLKDGYYSEVELTELQKLIEQNGAK